MPIEWLLVPTMPATVRFFSSIFIHEADFPAVVITENQALAVAGEFHPRKMFLEMEHDVAGSFLEKHTWRALRE
ncbi:MAG: hypothetical protein M0036_06400 [Desulfobacteraceae bacterium]|nr:hypothetical protein [Desulfobacteraceae bacterium]